MPLQEAGLNFINGRPRLYDSEEKVNPNPSFLPADLALYIVIAKGSLLNSVCSSYLLSSARHYFRHMPKVGNLYCMADKHLLRAKVQIRLY